MVLWRPSFLQVGPGLQNIWGILEIRCRTYMFTFLDPSCPVSERIADGVCSLCHYAPAERASPPQCYNHQKLVFIEKKNPADLPNRTTSSLCLSNPNATLTKCRSVTGMPHADWFGLEGWAGSGAGGEGAGGGGLPVCKELWVLQKKENKSLQFL